MVLHASPDGPSKYLDGLGLEPVRNMSVSGTTDQAPLSTAPRHLWALKTCLLVFHLCFYQSLKFIYRENTQKNREIFHLRTNSDLCDLFWLVHDMLNPDARVNR